MTTRLKWLLIALGVVIVGSGGFLYYQSQKEIPTPEVTVPMKETKKEELPKAEEKKKEEAKPTEEAKITEEKKEEEKETILQSKEFPPKSPINVEGWLTYTNTKYRYSVQYSPDWGTVEKNSSTEHAYFSTEGGTYRQRYNIFYSPAGGKTALDAAQSKKSDFPEFTIEKTKINNKDSYVLANRSIPPKSETYYTFQIYIYFVDNNYLVEIYHYNDPRAGDQIEAYGNFKKFLYSYRKI